MVPLPQPMNRKDKMKSHFSEDWRVGYYLGCDRVCCSCGVGNEHETIAAVCTVAKSRADGTWAVSGATGITVVPSDSEANNRPPVHLGDL